MTFTLIVLALLVLWAIGSWFVVRNIEEPEYSVVEDKGGYEIREYLLEKWGRTCAYCNAED